MEGYIKTYRKLLDWEWYNEPNTMRLFFHCLLKANYQEKKWQGEIIPPGSFVTSSLKLAEELHLSRQQIRHAISNLQTTNNITIKTTNRFTVITVLNWAVYQGGELNETTNKTTNNLFDLQPTNNQQTTTTKEYKELKELKKEELKEIDTKKSPRKRVPPTAFVPPTLEEIVAYVQERKSTVDAKRFYDYFTVGKWFDKNGSPVKNWKQKLITWETNNSGNGNNAKPESKPLDTAKDGFTYI
jgi:hypothetical protein